MVINGGWRDGKKQTKNAQIWDYIEDIQNASKSYIQSFHWLICQLTHLDK